LFIGPELGCHRQRVLEVGPDDEVPSEDVPGCDMVTALLI